MTPPIKLIAGSRGGGRCVVRAIIARSLAGAANTDPPPTAKTQPAAPLPPQVRDELSLLSRVTPLKRIVCLCPVPLGRGRVAWTGGDAPPSETEGTIRLDHRPRPPARHRYGERFAVGVAVSDPRLTRAAPVRLDGDGDDASGRRFVAEIVPTFRCDAHNLGSSPIFHTNLPYFRNEFLQSIGHFDVGAVVIAMPMKRARNPFCPTPTKVQLEQEQKLAQVRECLLGVLQNYVTTQDEEEEDSRGGEIDCVGGEGHGNDAPKRPRGPLDVQGRIYHRLSISDVLSRADGDRRSGSWADISRAMRRIQNHHAIGRWPGGGGGDYYLGNREYGAHNVFSSVPPEIHAAVALNAMMEKHTSGFQNSFF